MHVNKKSIGEQEGLGHNIMENRNSENGSKWHPVLRTSTFLPLKALLLL